MRTLKAEEIEIRVGTVGQRKSGGGYATLLLYKDARTDMQILDEVYGTNNWQKDYKEIKGNLYCGIGVWDEEKKQWIWKWDCGTESNVEKAKGEASDAMKRACFNVGGGIGRELYTAPRISVPVAVVADPYNKGRFKMANPYELSGMYVSRITYNRQRKIDNLDIAIDGTIIWSTDRGKVGLKHE